MMHCIAGVSHKVISSAGHEQSCENETKTTSPLSSYLNEDWPTPRTVPFAGPTIMNLNLFNLMGLGLFAYIAWHRYCMRRKPSSLPLPPGPKARPFIGNLFDFPLQEQWRVYDEWRKIYGWRISILDLHY